MDSLFRPILLEIVPPPLFETLFSLLIAGIIGFILCYVYRHLIVVVLPTFLLVMSQWIGDLAFLTAPFSNYMMLVYSVILIDILVIISGAVLSWRKYRNSIERLK